MSVTIGSTAIKALLFLIYDV
uniref:Uncharacterized protein n=1 Tax=Arundo donax TaxID=35708 RepID=A0A0A9HEK2_ARUDO